MRTLPTAISTGFSDKLRMFYLVKIAGTVATEGDTLYYWPTTGKNNAGETLVLKETAVGASLSYDSGMIAREVDGESRDGIGTVEAGVDINLGGGVSSVSDIRIDILNQERFDQTVVSTGLKLENRAVTVYMGFVPSGSTPTVVITTDMIKLYTGIIEEVNDYDFSDYFFRCLDSSFQRHKEIPTTIIDRGLTGYENAPKESIGQAVPVVYGAFYVDETAERDLEEISPAPTVKINDLIQTYAIADHQLHTISKFYYFAEEVGLFAQLTDPDTTSNTSAGATGQWATGDIIGTIRQIPKNNGVSSTVADISNAVDDDYTVSKVTLGNAEKLYGKLDNPPEIGVLVDSAGGTSKATLRVKLATVSSGKTATLNYNDAGAGDVAMTPPVTVTDADSDSIVTGDTAGPITFEDLANFQFGAISDAAAGNVEVLHMVIEYHLQLFRLGGPRRGVYTGRGRR